MPSVALWMPITRAPVVSAMAWRLLAWPVRFVWMPLT